MMKRSYLIGIVLFISIPVLGQQEILRNGKEYSRAKIYFSPTKSIKVRKMTLHDDSYITYYERATNNLERISIMDMKVVSVKKGTHVLGYSIGGAVVGLGLSYLSSQTQIQFPVNGDFNQTRYMIGFIAGTTILGGILGIINSKWKSLYVDKTKLKSRSRASVVPQICLYKDYRSFGFNICF